MLTVYIVLAIAAFLCAILSATSPARCPLWVSVMLICVLELLRTLPLGR